MITILHTESSTGWGGQEIRIIQEALGLRKRGYRIFIIAEEKSEILKKSQQLEFDTFPIRFSKYNPLSFLKISSLIKRLNIDIVNTHSSKDSWVTILASQLLSKKPKIIRTRHLSTPIKNNTLNRLIYNVLTDMIITTGERIREKMIKHNKFDPNKIISIPTGVDLGIFNPNKVVSNKNSKEFTVGTIGVLRSWKGHSYLLEAVPLIVKKIPNIKFYIVGEGPQRENLLRHIKNSNLEKWVIMTGHRDDIPQILASLDVVIHPSYANEGIPQVILQALAMKKPVIASNIDCINEIIIHNKTGILIKPKNFNDIVESILKLYNNEKLRFTLAENGRKLVEENYSHEKMLEKIENVYKRLLFGKE